MPRIVLACFFAACVLAAPGLARADGDSELDRIPSTPAPSASSVSPTPTPVPGRAKTTKTYVEDTFTESLPRNTLIPYPSPLPAQWENSTSLDTVDEWGLTKRLSATFSDRFNVIEDDRFAFASNQSIRNDLREVYLDETMGAQTYFEAGRINVRNGVALGFNPTDFFKTNSLVEQASLDPSVIREDRLGTFMLHLQTLWDRGSADVSFAPKLSEPSPISAIPKSGLDPGIGKTNASDRFELAVNYNVADLSPEVLLYTANGHTEYGLNLSRGFGQNVVGYAEWAGGRGQDLAASAIAFAKSVGTLPESAPILPPTNPSEHFQSDLAAGGSLTAAQITFNLEYHYHQAGFSAQDWQNWFNIGTSPHSSRAAKDELWLIRGYANAQQEPVAQQQIFVRADRPNAFVSNLELTAFTFVDVHDASTLSQFSATYALSSRWSVSALFSANVGAPRSERGSFPQSASAIVQAVRYF